MNPHKCSDDDYLNFVTATPRPITATEAAKVQGDEEQAPAHHALTRLLHQLEPDAETLWTKAPSQVSLSHGILVIDDSTLDKSYARKVVATDRDVELWATNQLEMTDLERVKWASFAWTIERYHRGIKQFCLIERAQVRSRRPWRNHIGLCLRAFLRLESHCYYKGLSWFEAKKAIIREALRVYIANPLYSHIPTA